jgi:serine/threonine protein kinase
MQQFIGALGKFSMTEETIVLTAIGKVHPDERTAYLDEVCAGDPKLRQRVEVRLAAHGATVSFLGQPGTEQHAAGTDSAAQTARPAIDRAGLTPEERAILGPARTPGTVGGLDHYDLLELAGRGGMGTVFKALDTKLNRLVAVKLLAPALVAVASARARFIREAQAAAAIRDAHVVHIYAVHDERAFPYLVMEYLDGPTLEKHIRHTGALGLRDVLWIGMQAAEGLAAAHRQGLIHRDIKPANILLESSGECVKVTDFGLARAADHPSLSQAGVIAGTPLYMSPEQARGETLDARSDLFSLGSVLYTMATGCHAFAAAHTVAVLKRVCEETPRPIRELNPEIPDWFTAIVGKLQAKDPAERYQSAAEVVALLGEHLATGQPAETRQIDVPQPAAKNAATPWRKEARSVRNWSLPVPRALHIGLVAADWVARPWILFALFAFFMVLVSYVLYLAWTPLHPVGSAAKREIRQIGRCGVAARRDV